MESGIVDIWDIMVNQFVFVALIFVGIFEINGMIMWYEIVQIVFDIGVILFIVVGGFGSINGGVLGNLNIQMYEKIEQ